MDSQIDSLDQKILTELMKDARTPLLAVDFPAAKPDIARLIQAAPNPPPRNRGSGIGSRGSGICIKQVVWMRQTAGG